MAHLSDLHATPARLTGVRDLARKRMLGWLSWRVRRRHAHRPEVLGALIDDLAQQAPDQVAISGDLTNIAAPREFEQARAWLERIGPPERVSLVPGNHDAYVALSYAESWRHWEDYLVSDAGSDPVGAGPPEFPTLRRRGALALIGVCSANPTAPGLARGTLGAAQRARLEALLDELGRAGCVRVISIHHPITAGTVTSRRELTDAAALRDLLARVGAELVLHGHGHRQVFGAVPGPRGSIPVIGVRSASEIGSHPDKRAQYHLYEIDGGSAGASIALRVRGYDPASGAFRDEGAHPIA